MSEKLEVFEYLEVVITRSLIGRPILNPHLGIYRIVTTLATFPTIEAT